MNSPEGARPAFSEVASVQVVNQDRANKVRRATGGVLTEMEILGFFR